MTAAPRMQPSAAVHQLPSLPLIHRAGELAALTAALERAESGRGATVFISGEGGVGKTRLASALAEQAAKRGWTVVSGRAYPVETGVPYAPFSDALLPLLRGLDAAQLSLLTRGGISELVQVFPALGAELDRAPSNTRGEPAELKARLLWNVSQLLVRLAARKPLLVLLDNLQWADASSLELLHFVSRQAPAERILFACAYNSAERDTNPTLRDTENSLVSLGVAQVLPVAPLTLEGTRELVERAFCVEGVSAERFSRLLHERTRGNPFFVEETLKALVTAGSLTLREGVWLGWEVEDFGLPGTIRDTVLARLSRLGEDARAVGDLMAVIGSRVEHEALAATADLSESRLLAGIDELRRARVLVEEEERNAIAYDFAHPLLRETLYGELGRARARALHARVAEALERHYGDRALAHADELAFHYARADARSLAAKAVRYLVLAGRAASEQHANREAADYLAAALSLAERDDPEGGNAAAAEVPRLVRELARVRQRLGDYDGALSLWSRARQDAVSAGRQEEVADLARSMGLSAFWSGRYEDALAEYEAGLSAAHESRSTRRELRLLVARGMCLQAIGKRDEAEQDVRAALALAEEIGEPALLARVHRALLLLFVWTGPATDARTHGERAITLAEVSGDRGVAWSAHWALATLAGLTGDATGVARHLGEAERLAEALRSPLLRVWTAEVAIEYAAGTGNWENAVVLAERTTAMARALGQRTLLPRVLVWTGLLHLGRGDLEKGEACVSEAWELSGAGRDEHDVREVHLVVPAHLGMAALHLARRDWKAAIETGERGLRLADRTGYVVWGIHRLMPVIAEAALWSADHARAQRLERRLRRDSTRLGHRLGLAWADACAAVAEMLKGDKAKSVALLRSSCEALDAIPFVPDAARLRRQLARALAETGDREGALRELRRAHEVFVRLHADRELDETREQMRQLGGRPPGRSLAAGAAGLTARELEIVRYVAARRSNKEIGRALRISDRTVSTHLSNIYGKLGVASRGELADVAREERLVD